jgi:hypothetical protein
MMPTANISLRLHRGRGTLPLLGRRFPVSVLATLLIMGLSGCLSPITLDRTVIAYDGATTDTLSRQLLLNIARARHHEPIHFTGVSNIAATFNFQVNAGATPPLGGLEGGFLLSPIFGGSVAENPTISIIPIEGEEFTKRLLTPFQEGMLTLLLRQGVDVDLLLRLMAGEFRMKMDGKEIAYYNKPSDTVGYSLFRQVVLHLSSIQDRNALYVEPLLFERSWTLPGEPLTPAAFQALEKEFAVIYNPQARAYRIIKRITGRILITNYDPTLLSNEERIRLHEEAERNSLEEITVDIRPGHVGGEYPLHGKFRLRSFHNVINFLGRAMGEEPEYDVSKDPRTPLVTENPVYTMEVMESDPSPPGVDRVVRYNGYYYAVRPEKGYQWNKESFRLLYQLFQMTIVKLPQVGVPGITISK